MIWASKPRNSAFLPALLFSSKRICRACRVPHTHEFIFRLAARSFSRSVSYSSRFSDPASNRKSSLNRVAARICAEMNP